MDINTFSVKWFTIYYAISGLLVFGSGLYLMISPHRLKKYLLRETEQEKPPSVLRIILKYLLLFTIPCLILSFIPFSWLELLFSIWSLSIVYLVGIQLVRWNQTRSVLIRRSGHLTSYIRITGVIMLTVSIFIFLLCYLVIKQPNLL